MAPVGLRRVLIVDDDPLVAEVLASIMQMVSDEVVTVDTLKKCMEAVTLGPFALVLLDLMLPDSRSYKTLEAISKIKEMGGRRVVVITGAEIGAAFLADAKQRGAETVLSKNNDLHKSMSALFD